MENDIGDIDDIADIADIENTEDSEYSRDMELAEFIEGLAVSEPEDYAAPRDKETLITDPETDEFLDRISGSVAWRFHQEKDDVKQELRLKMLTDSDDLRDPACIKGWVSAIATNWCLNKVRRQKLERSYLERKTHEAKESTSHNGEALLQSSPVQTPEDELLESERYSLIQATLLGEVRKSPKWLADAWGPEKSTREMIAETGKPPATVYRHLKNQQKRMVNALREIGIEF